MPVTPEIAEAMKERFSLGVSVGATEVEVEGAAGVEAVDASAARELEFGMTHS
jgi:hypothetical protein